MSEMRDIARDAASMTIQPAQSELREILEQGVDLMKLEELITQAEDRLKELKRQRTELAQRIIPDLMDTVGLDRVGIPGSSMDLVVTPFYHAVLPKETAPEAAKWLDDRGHGDIIKTFVQVEFATGEREHAQNVLTLIKSYFRGRNIEQIEPEIEESVHWKTLTSFVKEQVEQGEVLPLDLFGATIGRTAKVTKRKAR